MQQSSAIPRTYYESYSNERVYLDARPVRLDFWDTSGVRDLAAVEKLSYIEWDCVLLCYDVKNRDGLLKITQWVSKLG